MSYIVGGLEFRIIYLFYIKPIDGYNIYVTEILIFVLHFNKTFIARPHTYIKNIVKVSIGKYNKIGR